MDRQSITCTIDHSDAPLAVGSLVRGPLTCIDAATPFAALRTMHLPQPLIPVVDGPRARYVGCISVSQPLFDVALELPPRVRAALLDCARVSEVMSPTAPIPEGATLLAAAAAMTRARARHLPVVAQDGSVAGIIDDLTLLMA